MKQLLLILLLLAATAGGFLPGGACFAKAKHAMQQPYIFWFQNNGVLVYYRWTCAGCSDKHIVLKVVNENNYGVKVSFDKISWKSNGATVKTEAGEKDYFKAGETKSGDYSGYWFYPPDGYANVQLSIEKTTVEKDDGGL
jgi:hypothetical protein